MLHVWETFLSLVPGLIVFITQLFFFEKLICLQANYVFPYPFGGGKVLPRTFSFRLFAELVIFLRLSKLFQSITVVSCRIEKFLCLMPLFNEKFEILH